MDAVNRSKKDEEEEASGSKSMANSIIAIRSIKAGLKKKLAHTDGYLKYIEDSNRLISENTKKMESVYSSDMNPAKQEATVDAIESSISDIKDQTAQCMDLAIARLRRSQETLVLKIEQYLELKRYDAFKDSYKLSFEALYDDDDS